MRTVFKLKRVISILILCFFSMTYGQDATSQNVDELIKVYKAEGVDATLKAYRSGEVNQEYEGLQEPLNQLGYRILNGENDAEGAARVFMAQIEEYPDQPNPYDSYADAMLKKGDDEEAKKHLQKAISLMDNMEDEAARKNLLIASKSKLSRLEGKHEGMNFLLGNWHIDNYSVEDGKKTLRFSDDVTFESTKYNTVIITKFVNEEDKYEGTQLMTYNALKDEYDVVRVDNNQLNGFQTATFKLQEDTGDKIIMIEKDEQNGKPRITKHVFTRKNGELEWEIHEQKDNKNTMVGFNHMKKK